MNKAQTIPATARQTALLPVMEHFYTLQGEGVHQGRAAYFIRLGGCDVGCAWCDVKESWDASTHPLYPVADLVSLAKETPAEIVVITGGEPLLHDLTDLTTELRAAGLRVHMETSGSSPMSGQLDWVTLSPKKFKAPLPEAVAAAHELKVVIFHPSDFLWAEQWAAQVGPDCRLFLQPEWDRADRSTPLIIDYVKQHPQWRLSLQIHKYINVP
ncbi:MAG: 7-carboxy-7-deazaguanine synthase QueE [Flaviaesturariibacter sp.]|nr:7-carboxy-7-deazaguanine synthase QueE [Flaviaesturariibacter sp.]